MNERGKFLKTIQTQGRREGKGLVGCEQKPWATVSSVRVKVGELPAFWGWGWGGPCPVTLSKNKAASTNSQHNTGVPPSRKKKA